MKKVRPTKLLDFLCVVLFHILNNISYRYFCALGIFLYIELVMKGRTVFSHVDVKKKKKSLFEKKKNQNQNPLWNYGNISTFTMTSND